MTDKSARDEIARHYGAHEIGGSLDDMYEFERERCYDFADRLIAALDTAGLAVVHRALLLAAIPEDDDAGLPTAEDVRGILKPEGK